MGRCGELVRGFSVTRKLGRNGGLEFLYNGSIKEIFFQNISSWTFFSLEDVGRPGDIMKIWKDGRLYFLRDL